MADNAQLFKYAAKSIGMQYGVVPSFMAKPWGNVSFCIFPVFTASDSLGVRQLPGCSGLVRVLATKKCVTNARLQTYTRLFEGRQWQEPFRNIGRRIKGRRTKGRRER